MLSVPALLECLASAPVIDLVYPDDGPERAAAALVQIPAEDRWVYLGTKRRPGFGSDRRPIVLRSKHLREVAEPTDDGPRFTQYDLVARNDALVTELGGREVMNALVPDGQDPRVGALAVLREGSVVTEVRLVDRRVGPLVDLSRALSGFDEMTEVVWRPDFEATVPEAVAALVGMIAAGTPVGLGAVLAELTGTPPGWTRAFFTGETT